MSLTAMKSLKRPLELCSLDDQDLDSSVVMPRASHNSGGGKSGGGDDVVDKTDEVAAQERFWKAMITSDDIETVNSAAHDEQEFHTLAKHFWNRSYLFHRCWTPADQKYVYDRILGSIESLA